MGAQDAALISVITPAVITALVYFVSFEGLRWKYTEYFSPRFPNSKNGEYPHKGVLSWIWNVVLVSNEEVLLRCGFDSVVYLEFMSMCTKILAVLSVLGMLVLASAFSQGEQNLEGMVSISLSNLKASSTLLWVPATMIWVFSLVIIYFVQQSYSRILNMRNKACKIPGKAQYTVLITKIPLQYNDVEKIREFLEPLFPEEIAYVYPVEECTEISNAVQALKGDYIQLLKAKNKGARGETPMMKTGWCGIFGDTVPTVQHYEEKTEARQREIERMKKEGGEFVGAAFVTFSNVANVTKAGCIGMHCAVEEAWEFEHAPVPKDLFWENLFRVPSSSKSRSLHFVANSLILALIIFYAIPVAFGSALANLKELDENNSWLHGISNLPPILIRIIQDFGPTLWRVVLMLLVDPILRAILFQTRIYQQSNLELKFVSMYYMFLLVNMYFITLVSSSIFDTINEIIARPMETANLIGAAVPRVAIDMMQFIVLQGFSIESQKIIRIGGIVKTIFFSSLAHIQYERDQAMKPDPFYYGSQLAYASLVWTLCCCYMTITPLILLFGLIYFAMGYTIQKYNLLYVHVPEFTTYGKFWPLLIQLMLNGLLIGQIALMIVIGLMFGYMQQIMLFPLPVITYLYTSFIYDSKSGYLNDTGMTLRDAAELDSNRNKGAVKSYLENVHRHKMWSHPCLRVDISHPLKEPKDLQEFGAPEKDSEDEDEGDAKTHLLQGFEMKYNKKEE
mmetsp:Transcript_23803/g.33325  ORF Transcript_23803/g.33325 Transcript_23803/m.33325 type:complete len:734 (+) Transcript_23803:135-2336(+)|eukprot:CAMPEP_0184489236 /NCGR_PEP_ID=MMETSP0113_2-20130426/14902_1 /TAXON_ID=91329 /ORGANISM="Norrisiella sphaerica, Strain BC52" /LENGTH=733 /DNA_ID=CAMNT_0026872555 /DNA_START=68 /DNA_END=2269 /DNA_ORIENTATION=-